MRAQIPPCTVSAYPEPSSSVTLPFAFVQVLNSARWWLGQCGSSPEPYDPLKTGSHVVSICLFPVGRRWQGDRTTRESGIHGPYAM